jgi:hypothetical protein
MFELIRLRIQNDPCPPSIWAHLKSAQIWGFLASHHLASEAPKTSHHLSSEASEVVKTTLW